MIDKQKIKEFLIKQEFDKMQVNEINHTDLICGSGFACDQVLDLGDQSQWNASKAVTRKLDTQAHGHEKKIALIKRIEFTPKSVVELGAIIETNQVFLIVATSIQPFELDGKNFVGVSIEAPLFKCMQGKKIGEECAYNDVLFVIKNIY